MALPLGSAVATGRLQPSFPGAAQQGRVLRTSDSSSSGSARGSRRGGGGVSTGTLPRAQRDSCPSSWRTDLRRSRHLACPFVELAKRDSCQAHSAKVQEYFKILPLLQPQLLLWPLKPAGGAGFLFGCAQPPGRKIPKEGLNQSQLNSLALY